jgi:hypothetical protein
MLKILRLNSTWPRQKSQIFRVNSIQLRLESLIFRVNSMLLRHYAEEQKKMLVDLQLRLDEAKIQTESGYLYLNRDI